MSTRNKYVASHCAFLYVSIVIVLGSAIKISMNILRGTAKIKSDSR